MTRVANVSLSAALLAIIIFSALGFLSPFVFAETSTSPVPVSNCGWNTPVNATGNVASSAVGSPLTMSIGAPSWEESCYSLAGPNDSTSGLGFPSYEVFPITIHGEPNTTINLQTGTANPTPQQVAEGVQNGTIWTWFNPDSVMTNSGGLALSNMTLAGAVMPFVPNDIGNVSLPVIASTPSGVSATAILPIDFEGSPGGRILVLKSPGPISYGSGVGGQAGNPSQSLFGVVYSPTGSNSSPIQVSLNALGTYDNGQVGAMPSGLQISFPQSNFELQPNSVFYFSVAESNDLNSSNTSSTATYTLAIQENIGNVVYVEPMTVTISLQEITSLAPCSNGLCSQAQQQKNAFGFLNIAGGWDGIAVISTAVVIIVVALASVLVWKRRKQEKQPEKEISMRES